MSSSTPNSNEKNRELEGSSKCWAPGYGFSGAADLTTPAASGPIRKLARKSALACSGAWCFRSH